MAYSYGGKSGRNEKAPRDGGAFALLCGQSVALLADLDVIDEHAAARLAVELEHDPLDLVEL